MCADKAKHQPSEKHTLDEVLKTLQDLVRNELADEAVAPSSKSSRRAKKDTQPLRDERADEAAPASEGTAITDNFEPVPAELSPNDFELQPQPATNDAPSEPVDAAQESPGRKKKKSPPPEQTSINWDDVPILNDVVTLPLVTDAVDNAALAAPEKAREIAVKAVAKLNIELRKAGNPTLDPVIIDRLEQLLRDALIAAQAKA